MNRMKKVKKIIMSVTITIMLLPEKIVRALSTQDLRNMQDLYGSPPEPQSDFISTIWRISKIFLIPLALIIGFIIYFKKSKSTTKRKVITMIIVLLVVIAICWGVNYLITNL